VGLRRALRMGFVVIAVALIVLMSGSLPVAAIETNYQNPVTALPPLVRPTTSSCTVTLADHFAFGPSGYDVPATGILAPPDSCPAPWSMVALDYTGSVAGRQFDRETEIWVGGVLIYFGTTPEPTPAGITWHVEKDVSQYATVFTASQPYAIHLPNVVNNVYTGIVYVTATLTFYPTGPGWPAGRYPDAVIGLSNNWIFDPGRAPVAAAPVTLPTNALRVVLELFAKGNSCDEFWYGSEPDAYADANGLCGGGAFREIQVTVDGTLAGVVWPFPYIFTGGVNPFLWRPIAAVGAYNEDPYQVDLTPFIGMLVDGNPHTIAFTVVNNGFYWQLGGNLLVGEDSGLAQTSGALTTYEVAPDADQSVVQTTGNNGATFQFSAARSLSVAGYVDTSSGRITTTVRQEFAFASHQVLSLVNFRENIQQTEGITSVTTTIFPDGTVRVATVADSYPIVLASAFIIPPGSDGFFQLPAHVDQALDRTITITVNDAIVVSIAISDATSASAVLKRSLSTGQNLVATGTDSELFSFTSSRGGCYIHALEAAQGFVTVDVLLC